MKPTPIERVAALADRLRHGVAGTPLNSRHAGGRAQPQAYRCWQALMCVVALFFVSSVARAADDEKEASAEDAVCFKCHGQEGYSKKLPDGKLRDLYISQKDFVGSVHLNDGCAACHSEEGEECLQKKGSEFASKRDHSIQKMKGCVDCHKVAVNSYNKSVHASLLTASDHKKADKTAVCSDCHKVHAEKFFDSKNKCLACHEKAVDLHIGWLPRTERHLTTVACESCHSPGAQRRVTLRIYEGNAPAESGDGVPQFRKLPAKDEGKTAGLDARAVWSLLNEFGEKGSVGKAVLRGRLEPRSAGEGHAIGDKKDAIRDCRTCHNPGSDAFKSVTLSLVGPEGQVVHADADKALLSSLESLGPVGGFYVLGATRIKLLDYLLLLVAVGAAGVPIGHLSARMISKRMRERQQRKIAGGGK